MPLSKTSEKHKRIKEQFEDAPASEKFSLRRVRCLWCTKEMAYQINQMEGHLVRCSLAPQHVKQLAEEIMPAPKKAARVIATLQAAQQASASETDQRMSLALIASGSSTTDHEESAGEEAGEAGEPSTSAASGSRRRRKSDGAQSAAKRSALASLSQAAASDKKQVEERFRQLFEDMDKMWSDMMYQTCIPFAMTEHVALVEFWRKLHEKGVLTVPWTPPSRQAIAGHLLNGVVERLSSS